jgi:hypothetical protein
MRILYEAGFLYVNGWLYFFISRILIIFVIMEGKIIMQEKKVNSIQGGGFRRGRSYVNRNRGGNKISRLGECLCPSCGKTIPHQLGLPCTQINCPNCGSSMVRNI